MAAPRCFLSPPSSKCLHRLRVIWCLTLHEVHSRRRTTFLVCSAESAGGAMRAMRATRVQGWAASEQTTRERELEEGREGDG